jgi:hypothetical protein
MFLHADTDKERQVGGSVKMFFDVRRMAVRTSKNLIAAAIASLVLISCNESEENETADAVAPVEESKVTETKSQPKSLDLTIPEPANDFALIEVVLLGYEKFPEIMRRLESEGATAKQLWSAAWLLLFEGFKDVSFGTEAMALNSVNPSGQLTTGGTLGPCSGGGPSICDSSTGATYMPSPGTGGSTGQQGVVNMGGTAYVAASVGTGGGSSTSTSSAGQVTQQIPTSMVNQQMASGGSGGTSTASAGKVSELAAGMAQFMASMNPAVAAGTTAGAAVASMIPESMAEMMKKTYMDSQKNSSGNKESALAKTIEGMEPNAARLTASRLMTKPDAGSSSSAWEVPDHKAIMCARSFMLEGCSSDAGGKPASTGAACNDNSPNSHLIFTTGLALDYAMPEPRCASEPPPAPPSASTNGGGICKPGATSVTLPNGGTVLCCR